MGIGKAGTDGEQMRMRFQMEKTRKWDSQEKMRLQEQMETIGARESRQMRMRC